MHHHDMNALQALDFVRTKRPICSPNDGFMAVILTLESELTGAEHASLNMEVYRDNRFSSSTELAAGHECWPTAVVAARELQQIRRF